MYEFLRGLSLVVVVVGIRGFKGGLIVIKKQDMDFLYFWISDVF